MASASEMSGETSSLARTLPLTCTIIVTDSTLVIAGSATGQLRSWTCSPSWRRAHSSAVMCGAIGASSCSSVSMANGVEPLLVQQVRELHEGRDRGVVRPPLELVGHALDQPVRGSVDLVDGVAGRGRHGIGCRLGQPPHAMQEPTRSFDALVVPVDVVGRRRHEQDEQPQRVGADRVARSRRATPGCPCSSTSCRRPGGSSLG